MQAYEQKTSWLTEPWVWFNIVLLLMSVIGGLFLLALAFKHKPTVLPNPSGILISRWDSSERVPTKGITP